MPLYAAIACSRSGHSGFFTTSAVPGRAVENYREEVHITGGGIGSIKMNGVVSITVVLRLFL